MHGNVLGLWARVAMTASGGGARAAQADVMLIDNFAAQHSRRPFEPPRRILAYLFN